jgi:hypothetical protein
MITIAKRRSGVALANSVWNSELALEPSTDDAVINKLLDQRERLANAVRRKSSAEMSRRLAARLAKLGSSALGGLPNVEVEVQQVNSRLSELRQSPPDRLDASAEELRKYLLQFEEQLFQKHAQECCSLSRDIRVDNVVLVIVDEIRNHRALLERSLELFKQAIDVFRPIGDARRYAHNITVRRKRLQELYWAIFTARENREAFLGMKSSLLSESRGMFVAFANGEFIASATSWESLTEKVQNLPVCYIEVVDDAAFQEDAPIETSPALDVLPV